MNNNSGTKLSNINKISSIVSILIFVLVIAIPLLCINRNPQKVSIVENKTLSRFPWFYTNTGSINKSFLSEFENYITDNIGFKQEAVVADIALEYKLFHKLKVPNYIEGKDENLFYISGGAGIDNFQGKNIMPESERKNIGLGFSNMQSYFESTGSQFYMITIPDKETIYPEYYPDTILNHVNKTRTDILDEYLTANTDVNVINMKQTLLDNKGKDMLYYKNYDCTHWNMNGAFVGYTEIMKNIRNDFSDIKVLRKDDFEITAERTKGSMAYLSSFTLLNNTMALNDTVFNYNLKGGYHAEKVSDIPKSITIEANDKFFHYVNKSMQSSPKVLIIGDSYIYSFILPILAESFSEVYFTDFTSAQEIMDLQKDIKADIVIYEFVERIFDADIYSELVHFNSLTNYNLKELPTISDKPVLFVDDPIVNNNSIDVDSKQEYVIFNGWGIDIKEMKVAGAIYLKIGENYYTPDIVERPDLKENKMAGFKFKIPVKNLKNIDHIEFIIISNDNKYQYKPVMFNINLK